MTATNINKLGVWSHLHKLFENSLLPPHDPKGLRAFAGKTILIAGATSEIMVRAAIKFARLGAHEIILGARDLQIASVARDEIEVAVKRPKGFVLVLELDLSSFPSVEDFVNNVQKATSKVHAVILSSSYHNEEGINEKHEIIRSPHGSEMNLQVNVMSKAYLAIFLLALLLETSLKEECPTHLEFADIGWYGDWDFEALLNPERPILEILNKYVCPSIQFPTAKFLEMAVMYQLSKRVDPSKVIVFAACSGTCEEPVSRCPGTNISKSTKLFKRLFARTFEQGSRILVTGVLQGPRIHGKLWKDDRVRTPACFRFESQSGQRLSGAIWSELFEGFCRMRNHQAIKAIMPNGQLADNNSALRKLYPRNGVDFPLSGDNDKSFWETSVVVDVDEEPAGTSAD